MQALGKFTPIELTKEVARQRKLNHILQECLPVDYLRHIHVANLEKNRLVLSADNPSWASKVRYETSEIAKRFSNRLNMKIKTVKVCIAAGSIEPQLNKRTPRAIPTNAVANLQALASNIADEQLSQSLNRLAKHGGR